MIATRTATALPAFRAATRGSLRNARLNSTVPPPQPPKQEGGSNIWLWLSAAGVAGLGGYAYMNRSGTVSINKDSALWAQNTPPNPGLAPDAWTPLKLAVIEKVSDNTAHYKFKFTGEGAEDKTSGLTVSSCLLLRSPNDDKRINEDNGKPAIRPYTPTSPPAQKGGLDLIVKSYPTGKISKYFSTLKEGDEVLMKGPIVKYTYKPNEIGKALFVAGGSGITPAWQMINHALALPEDKTQFTLPFANVTEKDILLKREWESLAARHPDRLKVVFFLDKAPVGFSGESGYITAEKIQKYFPRAEGDKVKAFVCGPPGQYQAVSGAKAGKDQGELGGALAQLGYKAEEVFKF